MEVEATSPLYCNSHQLLSNVPTASLFDECWSFNEYCCQSNAWFKQHNCSNETQGLRVSSAGLAFLLLFQRSAASFTLQPNVRAAPREMLPANHEAVSCTRMMAEWKRYLSKRVNARPDVICLKLVAAFRPQPSNKMWFWLILAQWAAVMDPVELLAIKLQLWATWRCRVEAAWADFPFFAMKGEA